MALSKLKYNSLNVTPTASKAIGFDSGADDLSSSLSGGAMIFIKKLTASSSSTLSFVDGSASVVLDDTYKEYLFTFNNIHPATDQVTLTFNCSVDSGSNYNVAKTTTYHVGRHTEDDTTTEFTYESGFDLAQGTGFQSLNRQTGNDNDQCNAGYLHLFNPSSTTFVKHYIARFNDYEHNNQSTDNHSAGYLNTTSAIDAIQFKFDSGNIDAGDICLYGIS